MWATSTQATSAFARQIGRGAGVSRPEGFHPRPLAERCVNLLLHTAPIRRTCSFRMFASAPRLFTENGLTVRCELDDKTYPKGIVVSDEEMRSLNIQRADFHAEWNYAIAPSIPRINAVDS